MLLYRISNNLRQYLIDSLCFTLSISDKSSFKTLLTACISTSQYSRCTVTHRIYSCNTTPYPPCLSCSASIFSQQILAPLSLIGLVFLKIDLILFECRITLTKQPLQVSDISFETSKMTSGYHILNLLGSSIVDTALKILINFIHELKVQQALCICKKYLLHSSNFAFSVLASSLTHSSCVWADFNFSTTTLVQLDIFLLVLTRGSTVSLHDEEEGLARFWKRGLIRNPTSCSSDRVQ